MCLYTFQNIILRKLWSIQIYYSLELINVFGRQSVYLLRPCISSSRSGGNGYTERICLLKWEPSHTDWTPHYQPNLWIWSYIRCTWVHTTNAGVDVHTIVIHIHTNTTGWVQGITGCTELYNPVWLKGLSTSQRVVDVDTCKHECHKFSCKIYMQVIIIILIIIT